MLNSNNNLSAKSLIELYKKMGNCPSFQNELNQKRLYDIDEVREVVKTIDDNIYTTNYSNRLREMSEYLQLEPMELLTWPQFSKIPYEIIEEFFPKDYSWLDNQAIVTKVPPKTLYLALKNAERIYKYPQALESLEENYLNEIFLYTELDYSRIPNIKTIVKLLVNSTYTSAFRSTFEKIIVSLARNHDLIKINEILSLELDFDYITIAFLCLERTLPCEEIQMLLDMLPPNITTSPECKEIIIELITRNFDEENISKVLKSNFATNLDENEIETLFCSISDFLFLDVIESTDNELYNNFFRKRIICQQLDISNISQELMKKFPDLFISEEAPQYLKELVSVRFLCDGYITLPLEHLKFLDCLNIEVLFPYMSCSTKDESNLARLLSEKLGRKVAIIFLINYGKYLKEIHQNKNSIFNDVNYDLPSDDIINQLINILYETLLRGDNKYDKYMPREFKEQHYDMFLPENVLKVLEEKYYNKQLTSKDFKENPNWINYFSKTNIAYGFNKKYSWLVGLLGTSNIEINKDRLAFLEICENLKDPTLEETFKEYVLENYNSPHSIKNLEQTLGLLKEISYSNSRELRKFKCAVAKLVLSSSNPLKKFHEIEGIFLKNRLPIIGKIFKVFKLLHPTYDFDFSQDSGISPILKSKSNRSRDIIIFSDLMKISLGSNNRNLKEYIHVLESGFAIFNVISSGNVSYESLSPENRYIFEEFCDYLIILYYSTIKGKSESNELKLTGNLNEDAILLRKIFSINGHLDYNIIDRITRMFGHFAGFDTLYEMKNYMTKKILVADSKNRDRATKDFVLKKGDFIKGINKVEYLGNILQNGSLAVEFLGAEASSDNTPLDTDLACVLNDDKCIREIVDETAAKSFGPIWIILRNDDRFVMTRTLDLKETNGSLDKIEIFANDFDKERNFVFSNFGIRTGFASSEIDYILVEEYDKKIGLEIAMNGFYIPVVNMSGEIVFTPADYDDIRLKMSGLSFYGEPVYNFSENLLNDDVLKILSNLEESNANTQMKSRKVMNTIKKVLNDFGLIVNTQISRNLASGTAELINTGSTKRETNNIGTGDFDFIIRLDRALLDNKQEFKRLKQKMLEAFGINSNASPNDFRLEKVSIEDILVDIDITFVQKTDKIDYSIDMALKEQLETIKHQDFTRYQYVIANIILAKQVLKNSHAYYSRLSSKNPEGGLSGIGIESWVLQNGGSFVEAAEKFLEASKGKDLNDFKKSYCIWGFGKNHLSEKQSEYPYNNFIDNLDEEGYKRMKLGLMLYLKNKSEVKEDMHSLK